MHSWEMKTTKKARQLPKKAKINDPKSDLGASVCPAEFSSVCGKSPKKWLPHIASETIASQMEARRLLGHVKLSWVILWIQARRFLPLSLPIIINALWQNTKSE